MAGPHDIAVPEAVPASSVPVAAAAVTGGLASAAYLGAGAAAAVTGGVAVVGALAGVGLYTAYQWLAQPAALPQPPAIPEWLARLNVTDETRALFVASGIDEAGFAALSLSQLRKMGVATSDQHELLQEITRRRASSTKPPRAAPATTKL